MTDVIDELTRHWMLGFLQLLDEFEDGITEEDEIDLMRDLVCRALMIRPYLDEWIEHEVCQYDLAHFVTVIRDKQQ